LKKKCKNLIKKKIIKKKVHRKTNEKINSNSHINSNKILTNSELNHTNNDLDKKKQSDCLLKFLKTLASDPER